MFRRMMIYTLMLALTLALGSQTVAHGAPPAAGESGVVLTVNVGLDGHDSNPGDGICTIGAGTICPLRAALEEANALTEPVTIQFAVANPYTINLQLGQLSIIKDVTITGDGVDQLFIDANGLSRVFNIVGNAGVFEPTVTITDLTIREGNVVGTQAGAAVRALSANVLLERVALLNNTVATACGGAIYLNDASAVTLRDSEIAQNTSQGDGGAICNQGGALTVEESDLHDNSVSGFGDGGAIYSPGGTLTVSDSIFSMNESGSGGAIAALNGSVVVTGSTFNGNDAIGHSGGAIFVENGDLTVTGSTLEDNQAAAQGGALRVDAGALTLTDSTVRDNSASYGGGVKVDYGSAYLSEVLVTLNDATEDGGGIYLFETSASVLDSQITLNTAAGASGEGGGLLQYNPGALTVERTLFEFNNAPSGHGGGLHLFGTSALIEDSYIRQNSAQNGGGITSYSALTVRRSTLANNTANMFTGGGSAIDQRHQALVLQNSTLSGNQGAYGALRVLADVTPAQVTHSTIAFNTGIDGAGLTVGTAAVVFMQSNIVAQNAASAGNDNCSVLGTGILNALDTNLDSDGTCTGFTIQNQNPLLGPLVDNGGATLTHMPSAGSPALNAGNAAPCSAVGQVDQRNYTRNVGLCDLGSVERGATPQVTFSIYLPLVTRQ